MATQIVYVDTPVTRFAQSFVNLTSAYGSTLYPAVTTCQIDNTMITPLTTYFVYDQWAFRTIPYNA